MHILVTRLYINNMHNIWTCSFGSLLRKWIHSVYTGSFLSPQFSCERDFQFFKNFLSPHFLNDTNFVSPQFRVNDWLKIECLIKSVAKKNSKMLVAKLMLLTSQWYIAHISPANNCNESSEIKWWWGHKHTWYDLGHSWSGHVMLWKIPLCGNAYDIEL